MAAGEDRDAGAQTIFGKQIATYEQSKEVVKEGFDRDSVDVREDAENGAQREEGDD